MDMGLSDLFRGKKKSPLRVAYIDDDESWIVLADNQIHQFAIANSMVIDSVMFKDGKQFIDYLDDDNECFDLVITDLFMPVMSGFKLIENLESTGCTSVIIAVTADIRLPERLSIVHKPFKIMDIMRRYMELRRKPVLNALQLGMCMGREASYG